MKLSREDELKEARLFWSRCWSGVSPQRLSSYREHLDLAPDAILDFLIDRGLRRVCDAGCGCGAYSLKLAQHGFSVSGFDISEEAVALADRLLSTAASTRS